MRPRRLLCQCAGAGALLARLCWASWGRADGSDVTLRIDCPALLDESGLATLEARARAELASAPPSAGQVAIWCVARSAMVAWTPTGERRRVRSVNVDPGAADIVDGLLDTLHELLFEKVQPEPSPDVSSNVPPATPASHGSYGLGTTAGIDSELWARAIPAAMGGHFGARVLLPGSWSATLVGGIAWGLGSAQGIHARSFRVTMALDCTVLHHIRVGLGGDARFADATGDHTPRELDGTTAGGVVFAQYVLRVGAIGLSAGPQVELLGRPLVVQIAGNEAFRIPTVLFGFSLAADADFGD
jgi:hypothetical protein